MDDAMDYNPHGNGLAWIAENEEKKLVVKWHKGMTDNEAKVLVKSLGDQDVLFHARISTAGSISGELCHPFPVELNPSISLTGESDMVIFHNGHFNTWEKFIKPEVLEDEKEKKKWSDSRAIAHALASGQLEKKDLSVVVNGVYAVLSTEPFDKDDPSFGTIEYFGSWEKMKGDVLASNTYFVDSIARGQYAKYWKRHKNKWDNDYRWFKKEDGWEYSSYFPTM
jgi:hypothetical protein